MEFVLTHAHMINRHLTFSLVERRGVNEVLRFDVARSQSHRLRYRLRRHYHLK